MAGRPVDHERRAELLDAVVDYAVERGLSEVTWRPVALWLGVAPATLVHRFGSKEALLQAIMGRLRERMVNAIDHELSDRTPSIAAAARAVWDRTSDVARGPEFRLFFAVYGTALQQPETFRDFLDRVITDWLGSLIDFQDDDEHRRARATLVIATLRGLLLDLLTTGDHARVDDAARLFLAWLETD